MTILDRIIRNKRLEIHEREESKPLGSFLNTLEKSDRNFKHAISKKDKNINLIAEIKKASPSEGIIRRDFDVENIAQIYDKYADAISVITDNKFFLGELDSIKKVREVSSLPILCKDFIVNGYQIYEARFYGADAILLIADVLTLKEINQFIDIAESLEMDVLLENKNKSDLGKSLQTNAHIIGINNRDLSDFSIDIDKTKQLSNICKDRIIVSESGIDAKEDIDFLSEFADAVLVGTSFMKSENIENTIKEIFSYE